MLIDGRDYSTIETTKKKIYTKDKGQRFVKMDLQWVTEFEF